MLKGKTGWTIGYGTARQVPIAIYNCPHCGTVTLFECGGGVMLDAHCCKDRMAYPASDPTFAAHLSAKPKRSDEVMAAIEGRDAKSVRYSTPSVTLTKHKGPSRFAGWRKKK